jgi:hypothetical protein
MLKKLMISALIAGSLVSFGSSAGRALVIDGFSNLQMSPVTKTGLLCGPGMHMAGLVCVPNRRVIIERRVCPPGWRWGPVVQHCVP